MKLKPNFNLQDLVDKYGFELTKGNKKLWLRDSVEWMMEMDYYIRFIDGGRRGQCYYLQVDEEQNMAINSTAPEGTGAAAPIPEVLVQMILDGIFVLPEKGSPTQMETE